MDQNSSMRTGGLAGRDVQATVKWFNRSKGFGFVSCADGSADAFLHVSVVVRAGVEALNEGAQIVCDLTQGPRGPQVAEIKRIDSMGTPSPRPMGGGAPRGRGGFGERSHGERSFGERSFGGDRAPAAATSVDGTVKFFNAEKGFGFVTPDDGGKDVFVHIRALQKSGIQGLEPQQRVRVFARMGDKGPMADSVQLL